MFYGNSLGMCRSGNVGSWLDSTLHVCRIWLGVVFAGLAGFAVAWRGFYRDFAVISRQIWVASIHQVIAPHNCKSKQRFTSSAREGWETFITSCDVQTTIRQKSQLVVVFTLVVSAGLIGGCNQRE
jgi:hypothetical protein